MEEEDEVTRRINNLLETVREENTPVNSGDCDSNIPISNIQHNDREVESSDALTNQSINIPGKAVNMVSTTKNLFAVEIKVQGKLV